MANLQLSGIIEKMTGKDKDKDYRYMATSDLLNELNKDSFKLDSDLEMRLSSIILQQLDDVAGDVSGLAVKCRFRTLDPEEADLFFVPVSPHKMRGKGISYENMTVIVQTYIDGLIAKYPYWNRTLGADHFFVTCHDVCVRVVCSPSYNVGFIPHKNVALPQVLQPFALPAGGNDVENR